MRLTGRRRRLLGGGAWSTRPVVGLQRHRTAIWCIGSAAVRWSRGSSCSTILNGRAISCTCATMPGSRSTFLRTAGCLGRTALRGETGPMCSRSCPPEAPRRGPTCARPTRASWRRGPPCAGAPLEAHGPRGRAQPGRRAPRPRPSPAAPRARCCCAPVSGRTLRPPSSGTATSSWTTPWRGARRTSSATWRPWTAPAWARRRRGPGRERRRGGPSGSTKRLPGAATARPASAAPSPS
mmetsp:Transcript_115217/g.336859  ORF Transcript_115217/g.336859 Transcript_115217/m.336859 type:complete len:238 (-) Transcript_115217:745-1458(-)